MSESPPRRRNNGKRTDLPISSESLQGMPKERNHRMTRQRRLILEVVLAMKRHPSAEEIYEEVRQKLPRISLGTVYRNLEVLSELGEIQKLELGGTQKRFDYRTDKHYHIRCIHCDRIDDAPIQVLNNIEENLTDATSYTVMGHSVEFLGLCPECMAAAIDRPSLGGLREGGD